MEAMVNKTFWKNKKVLVTGHTGFKGSWLSLWLCELGADVYGYSLEPDTNPSLFNQLALEKRLHHKVADIRDGRSIVAYVGEINPDVIIHMAAQPLVRQSYTEPVYTWETNVMGTINLLEAVRPLQHTCAVVVVTTDKVYENLNWHYAYRETDRLGGYDPYSSSKAAAEIVTDSWRNSFFKDSQHIRIASARAGNVIGGGDWAQDRIVPDMIRALQKNEMIQVRNPFAVRPWQHVLEPLAGYLTLAEYIYTHNDAAYKSAFNFGPAQAQQKNVKALVENALAIWPGSWNDASDPGAVHEAGLLSVSIDKALNMLTWQPKWDFSQTVFYTIDWYKKQAGGDDVAGITIEQINLFSS
jgi:CDP-glucose 4,6-dehydratase